ncbi:hypothetical protein PISMIDRAFT_461970 [Pisolithus microcarpus 441]|uniref:Uncharacterized protein n=1 Tax=Pisolithus microcarpus 441 TaxID=765257 RepID=A0A0C9YWC4_9AGAM|nr:hypothetical protein PISMIDRAFT_461970 [Pisolithus microcarpus 441]
MRNNSAVESSSCPTGVYGTRGMSGESRMSGWFDIVRGRFPAGLHRGITPISLPGSDASADMWSVLLTVVTDFTPSPWRELRSLI